PGRLRRAVFEVGLVDRGLAVLEAGRAGRVGAHPELLVVLVAVEPGRDAAADVPAAAEVAAQAQAQAGAQAVGVGLGAAAGTGFRSDVTEAHVAAGLPGLLGVDAAGRQYQHHRCGKRVTGAGHGPRPGIG